MHIEPVEAASLENRRWKWFGHCLRQDNTRICAKSLELEVPKWVRVLSQSRWDFLLGISNVFLLQYRETTWEYS